MYVVDIRAPLDCIYCAFNLGNKGFIYGLFVWAFLSLEIELNKNWRYSMIVTRRCMLLRPYVTMTRKWTTSRGPWIKGVIFDMG